MPTVERAGGRPVRQQVRLIAAAAGAVALIAGLLVGTGSGTASAAPSCHPYPDVTSANPHCGNIAWLRGQGITKPADGLYHPSDVVTRGSMTAFLFRLAHPGKPQPACETRSFTDVGRSETFCGYITWAAKHHLAFGYADGSYRADRAVTRGAMAAYLFRLAHPGRGAGTCTVRPFADVPADDMFCGVITWMVGRGITYGVGDGRRYGADQAVTRQQMASFLHRVAPLVADGGSGAGSGSGAGDDDGSKDKPGNGSGGESGGSPGSGPNGDPSGDPSGGPGAIPVGTGSQAYLAAIQGLTGFEDKLAVAMDFLPDDGVELTDLYYGVIDDDPTIAGITQFPSCVVMISDALPDGLILDVLRHEYIHVLQCRTYGLRVREHYGSDAYVERGADIGAYLIGANYLYYLEEDPFGLGEVRQWEVADALALLQSYGISVRQVTRATGLGPTGVPAQVWSLATVGGGGTGLGSRVPDGGSSPARVAGAVHGHIVIDDGAPATPAPPSTLLRRVG